MTRTKVAKGFDALAPIYDFFAKLLFCNRIHQSQVCFFGELPNCQNALVVGGGTGKFLPALIESDKVQSITYIDASQKMVNKARQRIEGFTHGIQFICNHFEEVDLQSQYDLVITPYFLDCFPQKEMEQIISHIAQRQTPNDTWLFSDFAISNASPWWRKSSKAVVSLLYLFFRLCCGLWAKNYPILKQLSEAMATKKRSTAFLQKGCFNRFLGSKIKCYFNTNFWVVVTPLVLNFTK